MRKTKDFAASLERRPSHEGVAAHFLVDMPHELAQRMREYYHASMNKRRPEDYPPESTGAKPASEERGACATLRGS